MTATSLEPSLPDERQFCSGCRRLRADGGTLTSRHQSLDQVQSFRQA